MNQDPIGLFGGSNFYEHSANPQFWIDPLGLSRTIVRYVSAAEAAAIKEIKGLVTIIGSNGKPSEKAVWVNDGSNFKPGRDKTHKVKITLNKSGAELLDNTTDYDLVDGETKCPNGVLTKSNEPGAKGIGKNLIPEINKNIESIEITELGKSKKRRKK